MAFDRDKWRDREDVESVPDQTLMHQFGWSLDGTRMVCPECGSGDIAITSRFDPDPHSCRECGWTSTDLNDLLGIHYKSSSTERCFHVAPSSENEAIATQGLRGEPGVFDNQVWAWKTLEAAKEFANPDQSIWEIDPEGLEVEPGEWRSSWPNSLTIKGEVGPERLRRVGAFDKDLWRQREVVGRQAKTAAMTTKQLLEFAQELGPDTSEEIARDNDGWTVRRPKTYGDLDRAGCMMGNCWALGYDNGGYLNDLYANSEIYDPQRWDEDPDGALEDFNQNFRNELMPHANQNFHRGESLRSPMFLADPDNIPRLGWHYDPDEEQPAFSEILGRHNSDPKAEYINRLAQMMQDNSYRPQKVWAPEDDTAYWPGENEEMSWDEYVNEYDLIRQHSEKSGFAPITPPTKTLPSHARITSSSQSQADLHQRLAHSLPNVNHASPSLLAQLASPVKSSFDRSEWEKRLETKQDELLQEPRKICSDCGRATHPVQQACPYCGSIKLYMKETPIPYRWMVRRERERESAFDIEQWKQREEPAEIEGQEPFVICHLCGETDPSQVMKGGWDGTTYCLTCKRWEDSDGATQDMGPQLIEAVEAVMRQRFSAFDREQWRQRDNPRIEGQQDLTICPTCGETDPSQVVEQNLRGEQTLYCLSCNHFHTEGTSRPMSAGLSEAVRSLVRNRTSARDLTSQSTSATHSSDRLAHSAQDVKGLAHREGDVKEAVDLSESLWNDPDRGNRNRIHIDLGGPTTSSIGVPEDSNPLGTPIESQQGNRIPSRLGTQYDSSMEPSGVPEDSPPKYLYHGTLADNSEPIQNWGLTPDIGDFVRDSYRDAYFDDDEFENDIGSVAYLADEQGLHKAMNSMAHHVAQALGKKFSDVTIDDLVTHGALMRVPMDQANVIYAPEEEIGYGTHPNAVEPDDYYSYDTVHGMERVKPEEMRRLLEGVTSGGWGKESGTPRVPRKIGTPEDSTPLGTPESIMYHWAEAEDVPTLQQQGFHRDGVYLTTWGYDPAFDWNEDIIWLKRPTRLTIDMSQLDLELLREDIYSEEYPDDNFFYSGTIPASAIIDVKEFAPRPGWKMDRKESGYYRSELTAENLSDDWHRRLAHLPKGVESSVRKEAMPLSPDDPGLPDYLYHVSPYWNRESIYRNGLYPHADSPWDYGEDEWTEEKSRPHREGVYFYDDLNAAKRYAYNLADNFVPPDPVMRFKDDPPFEPVYDVWSIPFVAVANDLKMDPENADQNDGFIPYDEAMKWINKDYDVENSHRYYVEGRVDPRLLTLVESDYRPHSDEIAESGQRVPNSLTLVPDLLQSPLADPMWNEHMADPKVASFDRSKWEMNSS